MAASEVQITPELVSAVRDAVDILDIAGEVTKLQRRGKRYLGICPFHKEKTPSFSVDPDQGLFYCFGCGAGGDAIKLFMEHSGDDFPNALEALARRYGIQMPERRARSPKQIGIEDALELAHSFFRQALARSDFAQRYLQGRDISPQLIERYGLGYAPDGWRNLLGQLGRRVGLEALEGAGLIGRSERRGGEPYDRFRHRLIFPIHTASGRLAGFGGRTLGDDRAKYINTAETDRFHKGSLLYGFHQAKRTIRDQRSAILVEGYTDVLAVAAAGMEQAVAGMGTALTAEQARLLARAADEVIVAYDSDQAGENAFRKALPILLSAGVTVRRAQFPAGHDPDSLRVAEGAEAVARQCAEAEDAVSLHIEHLARSQDGSPQGKARAAATVAELLRPIREKIVRYEYARRAAERLAVPQGLLLGKIRPASATSEEAETARREVRTEEERALVLLLDPNAANPLVEDLPEPEIFLDGDCRNIYRAFRALYVEAGRPPAVGEVLSSLDREGAAIDRTARILLEGPDRGGGDLPEILDRLHLRWTRQHLPELMRQIRQAQARGDSTRLEELLQEKAAISRRLHPGMTGKFL